MQIDEDREQGGLARPATAPAAIGSGVAGRVIGIVAALDLVRRCRRRRSSPSSPVTAGIRKIEPTTMPSAAAIERIHASTVSGVVVVRPKVVSDPASGRFRRTRPAGDAARSPQQRSAAARSPADFSSTVRNGGENIWESALMAASSMLIPSTIHPALAALACRGYPAMTTRGQPQGGQGRCLRAQPVIGQSPASGDTHAMGRLTRRSFLAASAQLAARAGLRRARRNRKRRPGEPTLRRRRRDRRRRRRRHRRRAAHRRGRPQVRRAARRRARSADAASPTRATFGVPYDRGARWLPHAGHQSGGEARDRRPGSTSIRRRPASACASAGATRAKARWRTFWRRWCAPTAPSLTPRARPTSPARRPLPKDLGEWRPTVEFMLGPYRRRQGPGGSLDRRLRARRRARRAGLLPPRPRRARRAGSRPTCRCGCRRR